MVYNTAIEALTENTYKLLSLFFFLCLCAYGFKGDHFELEKLRNSFLGEVNSLISHWLPVFHCLGAGLHEMSPHQRSFYIEQMKTTTEHNAEINRSSLAMSSTLLMYLWLRECLRKGAEML